MHKVNCATERRRRKVSARR